MKKLVLSEKLNTVDISLISPQIANVDYTSDEKQEEKENYTDYANLTPENKDEKQNKILYTAAREVFNRF